MPKLPAYASNQLGPLVWIRRHLPCDEKTVARLDPAPELAKRQGQKSPGEVKPWVGYRAVCLKCGFWDNAAYSWKAA